MSRVARARKGEDQAFLWADGVRLAGTRIWCDARRRQELCFVSHAGLPLAWPSAARAKVVTTARTLALAEAAGRRMPAASDVLVTPMARPFALGRLRLELLPAGFAPGSAQLLVELPGRRLLYAAGGVLPSGLRTVEPAQVRACDALALDPSVVADELPSRDEVEPALVASVRAALDDGRVPVVLCHALGGAGDVAALLQAAGVPLRAHRTIAAYLSAYESPILVKPLRRAPSPSPSPVGEAVLWPLEARRAADGRFAGARFLVTAAEAARPDAAARFAADELFALPDRADCKSLLAHAVASGARDVYFTAGLSDAVERAFRQKKMHVHPLVPPEQMGLFRVPC